MEIMYDFCFTPYLLIDVYGSAPQGPALRVEKLCRRGVQGRVAFKGRNDFTPQGDHS